MRSPFSSGTFQTSHTSQQNTLKRKIQYSYISPRKPCGKSHARAILTTEDNTLGRRGDFIHYTLKKHLNFYGLKGITSTLTPRTGVPKFLCLCICCHNSRSRCTRVVLCWQVLVSLQHLLSPLEPAAAAHIRAGGKQNRDHISRKALIQRGILISVAIIGK